MDLKIENVTYAYNKYHDALKGASAEFGPGIHLLLGPNGAGKTTLLKIIAGLLRPQLGECILGKESTSYHSPHAVSNIFLLTDDFTFPLETINDMAKRHAPFYPNFSSEFLGDALWAFGMTGNEKLKDMSLGNRHKAQLAYVLALGTKITLLDEPANGLDITSKKALASLLGKAMDTDGERCIVIATHTVQELRNLFDSVTVIDKGRIALNSPIQLIAERLAFINDKSRRDDAICYEPSIEGASQIVPNDGSFETPVDFILLYTAAIGKNSEQLKNLLS